MNTKDIIKKYISFLEKRGHKRIPNAPLVPENDPSTLFTSSGMQPLVPYLLGEKHPEGKRLVNVQNCFRAQDIDEVGDNRHITFFRMLGNWSLGDYFKEEQLSWFFDFLTNKEDGLGLDPNRLYVTVFAGFENIPKDIESIEIWKSLFANVGIDAKEEERIFSYGVDKNWWSRSGTPEKMPSGEPGGPDSEVFYDFGADLKLHEKSSFRDEKCQVNCDCGRYVEIGNSVFIQYQKQEDGTFKELPQKNVDFGGGLERLLMAFENQHDIFKTSLFLPIIQSIEEVLGKSYEKFKPQMRIITDHMIAAIFMVNANITPSNKEQGYILRRLIRRSADNLNLIRGMENIVPKTEKIIESIVLQHKETDPDLENNFETIKNTVIQELSIYRFALDEANKVIQKKYPSTSHSTLSSDRIGSGQVAKLGDELMGTIVISSQDAFNLYQSHGLSPSQIKSLGYNFDDMEFSDLMKKHQEKSRVGSEKKFKGGLYDTQELTIKGHTATHLLHQAIRDVLGNHVYQRGSNITAERVRFDFNFERKVTSEEVKKIEDIVNNKIHDGLPVHFEFVPLEKAQELGAIGLFGEKYTDTVKVYFIGGGTLANRNGAYSVEFCGGPHVENTAAIKKFKILKEEGIGKGNRRIYAIVE